MKQTGPWVPVGMGVAWGSVRNVLHGYGHAFNARLMMFFLLIVLSPVVCGQGMAERTFSFRCSFTSFGHRSLCAIYNLAVPFFFFILNNNLMQFVSVLELFFGVGRLFFGDGNLFYSLACFVSLM